MAHDGCRIFWQRCRNCEAVETSMHIREKKEWSKEREIISRCPANVPKSICVYCSDKMNFASNLFSFGGGYLSHD